MFTILVDSVILFSSTRFSETCRWDVPAAAVIHPHNLLLRLRFYVSHFFILMFTYFVSLTSSASIYSLFVIQFKRSLLFLLCLHFILHYFLLCYYTYHILLTHIIFYFTHSIYFRLRYFLNLSFWHCCPLLFRVDKICSYSHFIRIYSRAVYHILTFHTSHTFTHIEVTHSQRFQISESNKL